MPAMDDWERRAADLAEENRQRRQRVSPWQLAGTLIMGAISLAVWVWAVF